MCTLDLFRLSHSLLFFPSLTFVFCFGLPFHLSLYTTSIFLGNVANKNFEASFTYQEMEDNKWRVSYEVSFKQKVVLYADNMESCMLQENSVWQRATFGLWRQHRIAIFAPLTRNKLTRWQEGRHPEGDDEVWKFIHVGRAGLVLSVTNDN